MWAMLLAQQMLMVMSLFNVQMPAVVTAAFAEIKKFATLDFVSLEFDHVLGLNQTEAMSANFDQVGFRSMHFLNNMGLLVIPFAAYLLGLIVLNVADRMSCSQPNDEDPDTRTATTRCATLISIKLRNLLVHDFIVAALTQFYLVVAIAGLVNMKALQFRPFGEFVQSASSLLMLAAIVLVPIALVVQARRTWAQDENKELSTLLRGLRLDRGKWVLVWPLLFAARRLVVAASVTFAHDCLILQLMVMAAGITVTLIALGFLRPFRNQTRTSVEYFNEAVTYLVLYHMLVFTPFVTEPIARASLGYSCVGILGIHLLVHMTSILKENSRYIKFKLQLFFAMRGLNEELTGNAALKATRRRFKAKTAGFKQKEEIDVFDLESPEIVHAVPAKHKLAAIKRN